MNRRRSYVRYKILVGFDGVFSQEWDNEAFGSNKVEAFRKARAARFVNNINDRNAARWLSFVKKCAATKSIDLATFPIFNEFLMLLGEKKPKVALKALAEGDEDVLNFVTPLLAGLAKSDAKAEYEAVIADYVKSGRHLAEIARQYRVSSDATAAKVEAVVNSAITHDDQIAAIECLVFAITMWNRLGDEVIAKIFEPALGYLTAKKDSRWVRGAWYVPEAKAFFMHLSEGQNKAVLNNLIYCTKVDHQFERILACIGKVFPGLVWRYFGDRLRYDEVADEKHYEAIPYQFYDLNRILGQDHDAALREVRAWYKPNDHMFQFTGGRLLHSVFQTCTNELAAAATKLANEGGDDDLEFLSDTFRNYRGEPSLHAIAKAMVRKIPEDDKRLSSVEMLLENTGVVSGEFGMVEAMRERKALMAEWLTDNDQRIQVFATRSIRRLDNRIAGEQRGAEMRKEQRKRDYV
jgi:hypothetical protein